MSNVVKTIILAFLRKAYKPIAVWIKENVYTKTEVNQIAAPLHPVDICSLTPSSTFTKNSVIGINGVLYRATKDTGNLPVTLTVQDGAFVTHTVNGRTAFVVANSQINQGWEIFTDASVEYWVNTLNGRITSLESLYEAMQTTYTAHGVTYTAAQLLSEMARLMSETVVVK